MSKEKLHVLKDFSFNSKHFGEMNEEAHITYLNAAGRIDEIRDYQRFIEDVEDRVVAFLDNLSRFLLSGEPNPSFAQQEKLRLQDELQNLIIRTVEVLAMSEDEQLKGRARGVMEIFTSRITDSMANEIKAKVREASDEQPGTAV